MPAAGSRHQQPDSVAAAALEATPEPASTPTASRFYALTMLDASATASAKNCAKMMWDVAGLLWAFVALATFVAYSAAAAAATAIRFLKIKLGNGWL